MPKSVTVETATLADAVQKAAKIAPNKGAAYDKAAGIKIDVDPASQWPVTVSATDLNVSIVQMLSALETGGEACSWRLPSALLPGILMGLPLGHGSTLVLEEKDKDVHLKCNKVKGKLRRVSDDVPYPLIEVYDPSELKPVPGLVSRIQQVGWAASAEQGTILSGIHFDGSNLVATDRYKLVSVPCDVPVEEPLTAQIGALLGLLQSGEVKLGSRNEKLYLMPDDFTQITATIFADPYPQVQKVMRTDFTGEFTLERQSWIDALNRMMVLVKTERYPIVAFTIEPGGLFMKMDVPEVGTLEDELETTGFEQDVDKFEVLFTPTYLMGALQAAHGEMVKFSFGPKAHQLCLVEDNDDMRAYVMPRKVS